MSQAVQNASRFKGRLVVDLVDGVIARANPRVDWIVTNMIRKLIGGNGLVAFVKFRRLMPVCSQISNHRADMQSSGRCAVTGAMCPTPSKARIQMHHEPCFQKTHGLLDHWHAVSMANENHLETRFSV